ncbi:hypothetical protein FB451DRAFT_1300037 [Mycena latifolia]|nr:hypothetical protein FB451DRAFT_1300037 [Mycena latifolia]
MAESLDLKNGGISACGCIVSGLGCAVRVHSPSSAGREGYVFLTTVISPVRPCFPSQDASAATPASSPLHDAQMIGQGTKRPQLSSAPSHGPLTSSAYSPVAPAGYIPFTLSSPIPPPLRSPTASSSTSPSLDGTSASTSSGASPPAGRDAPPSPTRDDSASDTGGSPRGAAPARCIRPRSREFDSVDVAPRRGALWRHAPLIPPTTTLAPGFTLRGARPTRGSVKAAHPHVHQMRAVLLPAFRNTVRRVIIECSLDAAD